MNNDAHTPSLLRRLGRPFRDAGKLVLTGLGRLLPSCCIHHVAATANYLQLGRWMKDHGFTRPGLRWTREAVYYDVASRVRDQRVLYLEFGVFQGASMRYWSQHLKHPQTQLHGFDSFEGLPEAGSVWSKGEFDVGGNMPQIPDPRVQFHKGWFDQVLPSFAIPDHEVLVVNIDADLYSSTIFVLNCLKPHLKPGSFIYFDDMPAIDHEARAIHEYLAETGAQWKLVSAHVSLGHVFFECVSS